MSEASSVVLRGFGERVLKLRLVGNQRFRHANVGGNRSDGFTGCMPGADLLTGACAEHLAFALRPPKSSDNALRQPRMFLLGNRGQNRDDNVAKHSCAVEILLRE